MAMMDWLRVYNVADVIPFIEAVNKTHKRYYPDEINMLKDAVSIPGISMTYVLNKALKMKKPRDSDFYAPGQLCKHKCNEEGCIGKDCKDCKRVRVNCTQCTKNKSYELQKTGMVRGMHNARRTNLTNCKRLEWLEDLVSFSVDMKRLKSLR